MTYRVVSNYTISGIPTDNIMSKLPAEIIIQILTKYTGYYRTEKKDNKIFLVKQIEPIKKEFAEQMYKLIPFPKFASSKILSPLMVCLKVIITIDKNTFMNYQRLGEYPGLKQIIIEKIIYTLSNRSNALYEEPYLQYNIFKTNNKEYIRFTY